MTHSYRKLFEPYKIGNVEIKNRFTVSPMMISRCFDPNGAPNQEGINYHVERARGGFGLIITGAFFPDMEVDPSGADVGSPNPRLSPITFIRHSKDLTAQVHEFGSKIFAELSFGTGRNGPGSKTPSPTEPFGDPTSLTEELTVEEIQSKLKAVIEASVIAKAAGFDGVEIHGFHWGYLLDQFASQLVNKRTDEYGGSLENRIRICKEAVEGVKTACGKDFPVIIRVDMNSYIRKLNDGALIGDELAGRPVEENVEICKLLESYGYDALLVDAGIYESFYYASSPMYIEKGYTLDLAKAVKKEINIPLIVTGSRLDEPGLLLAAVAEDTADAVGLGRASLADPFLPRKYETGRIEEVKPCIACNTCIETALQGGNLHCAVNPAVTREELVKLTPSLTPKKVVIVGGGPGGMEAARVLKLRGNDVSLYEKTDKLGGNLLAAGAHDFKKDVERLNFWYQRELENLDIPVIFNRELSTEDIIELKPDVVVLATGSVPITIDFAGNDHDKVISSLDAIYNEDLIGDKVVIVGGGQVGSEIAIDLSRKGKDITVVELLDAVLSSAAPIAMINKMALMKLYEKEKIKVLTSARLDSVDDQGANVTLLKEDRTVKIEADTVIVSVGMKALASMAPDLQGQGFEVYEIGDGVQVGDVHTTIYSAFNVARNI